MFNAYSYNTQTRNYLVLNNLKRVQQKLVLLKSTFNEHNYRYRLKADCTVRIVPNPHLAFLNLLVARSKYSRILT